MECIIMSEEEVIEKFSDLVHIIATAKTAQPSDADDVYQEVFFRYIRKPPKFKSEAHAEAWFVTTTVNIIYVNPDYYDSNGLTKEENARIKLQKDFENQNIFTVATKN